MATDLGGFSALSSGSSSPAVDPILERAQIEVRSARGLKIVKLSTIAGYAAAWGRQDIVEAINQLKPLIQSELRSSSSAKITLRNIVVQGEKAKLLGKLEDSGSKRAISLACNKSLEEAQRKVDSLATSLSDVYDNPESHLHSRSFTLSCHKRSIRNVHDYLDLATKKRAKDKQQILDLVKEVKKLNTELQDERQKVQALEEKQASLEEDIEELEQESAWYKERWEGTQEELAQRQAFDAWRMHTLQQKLASCKKDFAKALGEISKVQRKLKQAQELSKKQFVALGREKKRLQEQKDLNRAQAEQIALLDQKLQAAECVNKFIQALKAGKQSTIDDLAEKLEEAGRKLAAEKRTVSTLQRQVRELSSRLAPKPLDRTLETKLDAKIRAVQAGEHAGIFTLYKNFFEGRHGGANLLQEMVKEGGSSLNTLWNRLEHMECRSAGLMHIAVPPAEKEKIKKLAFLKVATEALKLKHASEAPLAALEGHSSYGDSWDAIFDSKIKSINTCFSGRANKAKNKEKRLMRDLLTESRRLIQERLAIPARRASKTKENFFIGSMTGDYTCHSLSPLSDFLADKARSGDYFSGRSRASHEKYEGVENTWKTWDTIHGRDCHEFNPAHLYKHHMDTKNKLHHLEALAITMTEYIHQKMEERQKNALVEDAEYLRIPASTYTEIDTFLSE